MTLQTLSPTMTVVIPVKDDAEMLDSCLRALREQTRAADEVIVVDNGSSDDSAAVARRFGTTVLHESAPGIWAAAATGFDASRGDILVRCDADSRPPADWLERIGRALAQRPDAVAISGPGRFYDLASASRAIADVVYMRAYFWSMKAALGNHPLFGSNFALRASTWAEISDDVHRDDPDVHDDMDLGYHLDPNDIVLYDPSLTVGISGRPFSDPRSMLLRTRRALHTVAVHGIDDQPFNRWRRRVTSTTRGRLSMAPSTSSPDVSGRVPSEHEVP